MSNLHPDPANYFVVALSDQLILGCPHPMCEWTEDFPDSDGRYLAVLLDRAAEHSRDVHGGP